jgi:hypothetical protein
MKQTSKRRLRVLFGMLLGGTTMGARGLACGPCLDQVVVYVRVPPANPDGSPAPGFDPKVISAKECDELCGVGHMSCEAMVLDGDIPAVECVIPGDCAAGRRPRGLRKPCSRPSRRAGVAAASGPAAWLARAAHLEAASVRAFDALASELTALGAPPSLARRARTAAREEARHARVMAALSNRRGARVPAVRVRAGGPRSMLAMAIENAVEGCVRETFAALVAHHQARFAGDADVRRAMRRIADDETSHAALAHDVDAWLAAQLSPSERRRVEAAKRRAARSLVEGWRVDPETAATIGLPGSEGGRALATRLGEELGWRAASSDQALA